MTDPYAAPVVDYPWADAEIKPAKDSTGASVLDLYIGASFVARISPAKVKHVLRLLGE